MTNSTILIIVLLLLLGVILAWRWRVRDERHQARNRAPSRSRVGNEESSMIFAKSTGPKARRKKVAAEERKATRRGPNRSSAQEQTEETVELDGFTTPKIEVREEHAGEVAMEAATLAANPAASSATDPDQPVKKPRPKQASSTIESAMDRGTQQTLRSTIEENNELRRKLTATNKAREKLLDEVKGLEASLAEQITETQKKQALEQILNDQSRELDTAQSELRGLRADLNARTEALGKETSANKQIREELAERDATIAELQQNLQGSLEKLSLTNENENRTLADLEVARAEIKALQSTIEDKNTSAEELSTSIANLQKKLQEQTAELTSVAHQQRESLDELSRAREEIEVLKATISEREASENELTTNVANLSAKTRLLANERNSLEADRDTATKQVQNLQTRLTESDEKLTKAEGYADQLINRLNDRDKSISELTEETTRLNQDVQRLVRKATDSEQAHDATKQRLEQNEAALSQANTQLEAAAKNNAKLNGRIRGLTELINETRGELSEAKQQNADLITELGERTESHQRLAEELQGLTENHQHLTAQYEKSVEDLEQAGTLIGTLRSDITNKEQAIAEQQTRAEEMAQAIDAATKRHDAVMQRLVETQEILDDTDTKLRARERSIHDVERSANALIDQFRIVEAESAKRVTFLESVRNDLQTQLQEAEEELPPDEDLTLIKGIGRRKEPRLKLLGITSIQQIADLDDEGVDWLESVMSLDGDIRKRDWVGQAKRILRER